MIGAKESRVKAYHMAGKALVAGVLFRGFSQAASADCDTRHSYNKSDVPFYARHGTEVRHLLVQ